MGSNPTGPAIFTVQNPFIILDPIPNHEATQLRTATGRPKNQALARKSSTREPNNRAHERTFDSLLKHLDSSIDRIDIQRIEARLKTEKQEKDNILFLVDRITDLEKQVEKYKEKIMQLEQQTLKLKNARGLASL